MPHHPQHKRVHNSIVLEKGPAGETVREDAAAQRLPGRVQLPSLRVAVQGSRAAGDEALLRTGG